MRNGQVQALSLVLISGIVIALIGGAYFWGKPLIEKRTVLSQFASVNKFMDDLNSKIIEMSKSCTTAGACEENIDLPVRGLVNINENLTYEFYSPQPLITDETPINTGNLDEITNYGEKPGIIFFKGKKSGSQYVVSFKLHYRELYNDEQEKGYKIVLLPGVSASGTTTVKITYSGINETVDEMGNDLIQSKITVTVV